MDAYLNRTLNNRRDSLSMPKSQLTRVSKRDPGGCFKAVYYKVSHPQGWVSNFLLCLWDTFKIWWRHKMETFSALLAICSGNSPVIGEFPAQRPVTQGFDVLFDLRLNKRLSKQWRGWRFETPSHPLWRHCNVNSNWRILNTDLAL